MPASDNQGNLQNKKYKCLIENRSLISYLKFPSYFGLILLYGCGLNVKFLSAGSVSISGHIEAFGVPRSWQIKSS